MAGEWHFVFIHADNLGMLLGGLCLLENMFLSVSKFQGRQSGFVDPDGPLEPLFPLCSREGL